jgi:hypothetical protein
MPNDVFDQPGKCRKQCPSCRKYLHARSGFCRNCDHEFIPGYKAKFNKIQGVVVETYDKRGRGKKKCPDCNKYVGCRISACPCGFNFEAQPKVDKTPTVDQPLRDYALAFGVPTYRVMIAPSGGPPKKPKSTKKKDVLGWIEDNMFAKNDTILYVSALRHHLRNIYGNGSEDFTKVNKTLQEWFKNI